MSDTVALKVNLLPLSRESERGLAGQQVYSPGLAGIESKAMRFKTSMTAQEAVREIAGKVGIRESLTLLRLRCVRLGVFMEDDTQLMGYFLVNGDEIEVHHKPSSLIMDQIVLEYIEEMKVGFKPTLFLRNQKIRSLPGLEKLAGIETVHAIDVSQNLLTDLPPSVGMLEYLTEISAHHNDITRLPKELCKLRRLKRLYLQFNAIEELPEAISGLVSLEQINLRNNQLKSLPRGLGECDRINNCGISGNPLPGKILDLASRSDLTELRRFLTQGTTARVQQVAPIQPEPSSLDEVISAFEAVSTVVAPVTATAQTPEERAMGVLLAATQSTRISLESLDLTSLPLDTVNPAEMQVKTLSLAMNKLSTLPAQFGMLRKIISLDLENNNFTFLPTVILSLPLLETLKLGFNKLSQLPGELSHCRHLQTFCINDNQFQRVPPVIFGMSLVTFQAQNNPFLDFIASDAADTGHLLDFLDNKDAYIESRLREHLLPRPAQMLAVVTAKLRGMSSQQWAQLPAERSALESPKDAPSNLKRGLLRVGLCPGHAEGKKNAIERLNRCVNMLHGVVDDVNELVLMIGRVMAVSKHRPSMAQTPPSSMAQAPPSSMAQAPPPKPQMMSHDATPPKPQVMPRTLIPPPYPNKHAMAGAPPVVDTLKQRIIALSWDGVESSTQDQYRSDLLRKLVDGLKRIIAISRDKANSVIKLMITLDDREMIQYIVKIGAIGSSNS